MMWTLFIAGAAIIGHCIGQWAGAKAFEAEARREVEAMLRDPDEMEETAQFLREEAKALRAKRGAR